MCKNELSNIICQEIQEIKSYGTSFFNNLYGYYKDFVFVYNIEYKPISASNFRNISEEIVITRKLKDISEKFYEGFGYDIYNNF